MSKNDEHLGHLDHEEITVETLSTPPLEISPAPVPRRLMACIVDSSIIAAAYLLLTMGLHGPLRLWLMSASPADVVYLISMTFAYYFVQEGLFAATIGKLLLRLRVLGKDGEPCSFAASFKRNILRFVDWLPVLYVIGGIALVMSSQRQRIGDVVAATVVAKAPEKDINPPPAPFLFH